MSMNFYTYREGATRPLGAHGPVDEDTAIYCPWQHTLDPTDEQVLAAGWCYGPNVTARNAILLLRSLGLDEQAQEIASDCGVTLDPADVKARIERCQVPDAGQPSIAHHGNHGCQVIDCGLPAGYFAERHAEIRELCEQALSWGTDLIVA